MELLKLDSGYKEKILPKSMAWSLGLHLILFSALTVIISTQVQPDKIETSIKIREILIEEKTRLIEPRPQQKESRPPVKAAALKPASLTPSIAKNRTIQSNPKSRINRSELLLPMQSLPEKALPTGGRRSAQTSKTAPITIARLQEFPSTGNKPAALISIKTRSSKPQSSSTSPVQPLVTTSVGVAKKPKTHLINRNLDFNHSTANPIQASPIADSEKIVSGQAAQKQVVLKSSQALPNKNQIQAKLFESKTSTVSAIPMGVAKNREKTFLLSSSAKPFILSALDIEDDQELPGKPNETFGVLNSTGSPTDSQASLKLNREESLQDSRISGDELQAIRSGFANQIREKIEQVKKFPRRAKHRGWEGTPVVLFTLGKEGRLNNLALAKASEFPTLDEAALETIKEAAPFPKIPISLNLETMKFKLPISFVLE